MTPDSAAMMHTAHVATGGALAVVGVLFVLGVALYWWARPRR